MQSDNSACQRKPFSQLRDCEATAVDSDSNDSGEYEPLREPSPSFDADQRALIHDLQRPPSLPPRPAFLLSQTSSRPPLGSVSSAVSAHSSPKLRRRCMSLGKPNIRLLWWRRRSHHELLTTGSSSSKDEHRSHTPNHEEDTNMAPSHRSSLISRLEEWNPKLNSSMPELSKVAAGSTQVIQSQPGAMSHPRSLVSTPRKLSGQAGISPGALRRALQRVETRLIGKVAPSHGHLCPGGVVHDTNAGTPGLNPVANIKSVGRCSGDASTLNRPVPDIVVTGSTSVPRDEPNDVDIDEALYDEEYMTMESIRNLLLTPASSRASSPFRDGGSEASSGISAAEEDLAEPLDNEDLDGDYLDMESIRHLRTLTCSQDVQLD